MSTVIVMKRDPMNVLFIMADQFRWDHLGCTGHPYLKTPQHRRSGANVACALRMAGRPWVMPLSYVKPH